MLAPTLAETAAELAAGSTKVLESRTHAWRGKYCTVVLNSFAVLFWAVLGTVFLTATSCNPH